MDFIHRPVSQDQKKIKKLKIIDKILKPEQIKKQITQGPITNHRATYLGTHKHKH
jgi:hypothetical protein